MSQEDIELIKRCYEGLNEAYRSDTYGTAIEDLAHPDVVPRTSGLFPESGEYDGHEGLRQFAENQAEAFEDMSVEPLEMIAAGDRVAVPIRFGGRARHTGIAATFSVVHVWAMRDGKVAGLDMFRERGEALKAVGLEK